MHQTRVPQSPKTSPVVRPYRSRRVPPCNRCRQRKARCTTDLPGGACLLCRLHAVECQRPVNVRTSRRVTSHLERSPGCQLANQSENAAPGPTKDTSTDRVSMSRSPSISAHIMGPIAAQDAQALDDFLTHRDFVSSTTRLRPNPYNVYSNNPSNPVLYMNVPRRRIGLPAQGRRGFRSYEILGKLVEPHLLELIKLYFENFHPCFPIIEKKSSGEIAGLIDKIDSDALKSEIIACSFIFWNQSTILKRNYRPDIRYVWNVAVESLHEEFLAPSMSTLIAALIDLTGRPIYSITGNAINLGRTIALAYTLGLNRNPSTWQISEAEKNHRIIVWWAILIHDRWASLSHGTPPQINIENHDVPTPSQNILIPNTSVSIHQKRGAQFFIELCILTEKLGKLLPLVYKLQSSSIENDIEDLSELKDDLEEWATLRPSLFSNDTDDSKKSPGIRSLQLSYYTIQVSICRLALYKTQRFSTKKFSNQVLQTNVRDNARKILNVVKSLSENDLDGFWMPYCAYSFPSAITALLRCSLETDESNIANQCIEDAKSLLDNLRRLKDQKNWDLADICLAQCEVVVQSMTASKDKVTVKHNSFLTSTREQIPVNCNSEQYSNHHPGVDSEDQDLWGYDLSNLFPDLWDMFQLDGSGFI